MATESKSTLWPTARSIQGNNWTDTQDQGEYVSTKSLTHACKQTLAHALTIDVTQVRATVRTGQEIGAET